LACAGSDLPEPVGNSTALLGEALDLVVGDQPATAESQGTNLLCVEQPVEVALRDVQKLRGVRDRPRRTKRARGVGGLAGHGISEKNESPREAARREALQ
jgi:hypothetical protein